MGEVASDSREATAATRVALRGRDPFIDGDMDRATRFAQLADGAVHARWTDGAPLDPAVLA
jgi:hypothetical protein